MTSADLGRALALGLLLALAAPTAAQVTDTKPVRVKVPKPKKLKFEGEVLSMNRVSITVRAPNNPYTVHTFSFNEKLAPKMARLVDENRAYLPGDRVVIRYLEGTDTAVKIKGKRRQHR